MRPHSTTFPTMGTFGRVSWGGASAKLSQSFARRAERMEATFSRFRGDSEIMGLSHRWGELSPDAAAVLRAGQRCAEETAGGFGLLLGSRMRKLEALAGTGGVAPAPAPIGGRLEFAGSRCRIVDGSEGSVDLGAIAKGYASDQLRDLAVALGAHDVLVNLGGSSISVAGTPARIALSSPWMGWESIGTLTLESGSLSVSADPATQVAHGRQSSHVLDTATGLPAVTDLCAVIVCGNDGMVCEAYSTAYLAMGLDAAMRLDLGHPELDTIFMTVDGRLLASPKLPLAVHPGLQQWLKGQRGDLESQEIRTESRHLHPRE